MLPSALVVALALGTAGPCERWAGVSARLAQAAASSPEAFEAALARADGELGPMPRLGLDAKLPPPEQARRIRLRLEGACALQARAIPAAPPLDRAHLKAILDRPEFSEARTRSGGGLARLIRRIKEWLDGLFETRGAQGYAETTRVVVLAIAIAAVGAGLLRLWRLRRPARATAPRPATAPGALALDAPDEHLARARAALERDAREAIREGLLGLLSGLERRRLARPDRVKTNRELAAELPTRGANAELTARVGELLSWYDRAFYSLEPVSPAEARHFVESVGRLDVERGGAT